MGNINKGNEDLQLEVEETYLGNKPIFYVKGRIDTQTSEEFRKIIDEYFDSIDPETSDAVSYNLTLDFSEVSYVSSAGLRVILYTQKRLKNLKSENIEDENKEDEKLLSIINVKPEVMEIFEMTGFTEIIDILPFSGKE